jgi:hypothetical protein
VDAFTTCHVRGPAVVAGRHVVRVPLPEMIAVF